MYKALELSQQVQKIGQKNFKAFNPHLDRGLFAEGVKSLSSDLFMSLMDKYEFFKNPKYQANLKVEFYNENLNFKGTYLKFSRELGQSPWFIDGERVCESSVEEEIKNGIMKKVECDGGVLHAGGREDRDVRMLGNGRPFIIEIINPKNRLT
jgi:tRNA U54 and U55 pseudouridine synthase Pus10